MKKISTLCLSLLCLLTASLSSVVHAETKVWIAGDSTAAPYNDPNHQGWAALLQDYIDPAKATVMDNAKGGRSSRTFITEGHWQTIVDGLQENDIVIIQFGHNDPGAINDDSRARGSLPGTAEDMLDIDNMLTKQRERVYSFGHYIRQMVADARAKKAIPILMSPTVRNIWQASRIERGAGKYGRWSYELALELNTPYVDVTNLMADKLEALGEQKVAEFYTKDHTHFNPKGAQVYVETILGALKGIRPDLFGALLSEKGKSIAKEDSTWLRLSMAAEPGLRSVFLIGDSTVRNGSGDGSNGQWGWGDYLAKNLDTKRINVVNRAVGGLSSRTFYTNGFWQKALNMMRPGDVLVMQFGHNDAAPLNDNSRARGTINGYSDAYEAIDNLVTGKPEVVHSYGWYLRQFIGEARSRGITPVICTPVPRKKWNGSKINRSEGSYPDWARTVALQSGVAVIDLNSLIANEYDALGPKKVEELFADEHTHTSKAGAELNARIVADQLRPILGQ